MEITTNRPERDVEVPTLGVMRRRASVGPTFTSAGAAVLSARLHQTPLKIVEHVPATDDRPRFDILTLRQVFNDMDTDQNGGVDKYEWMQYLRENPRLKSLVLRGCYDLNEKVDGGQVKQEAKEMRRLLKVWRELDQDRNGSLEWEEFVEYFRRNGLFLEYQTKEENPRTRLAELISGEGEDDLSIGEVASEMNRLVNQHIPRRRSAEISAELVQKRRNSVEASKTDSFGSSPPTTPKSPGAKRGSDST